MKKKLILGLITSLLITGIVGCSSDNHSTSKKVNNNDTQKMSSTKMNMTDEQMKNMKSSKK